MPDIHLGAQIFDLVFHPSESHSTVYTALLTGHVQAFTFDHDSHKSTFSVRPSKRSCRALTINDDGSRLYAAGKAKAVHAIDTTTGGIVETRAAAHDDPINRLKHVMPWLFATGDDAGVIKLWDPRQQQSIRTHKQHFDYITDFVWLEDKHHLLATSGDGTLSVMDVRSKKSAPFAQSEDQEDELLCATTIKGGTKVIVGTQLGILSIFNRSSGYGDCVDRVPGHPASIDALSPLPPALHTTPAMSHTVLTGSSDGLVRAVQVLPTRLVGVVAAHGELPVERVVVGFGGGAALADDSDESDESDGHGGKVVGKTKGKGKGMGGRWLGRRKKTTPEEGDEEEEEDREEKPGGRWWVGSVGHDETLRLTDLEAFLRSPSMGDTGDDGDGDDDGSDRDSDEDEDEGGEGEDVDEGEGGAEDKDKDDEGDADEEHSDSDSDSTEPTSNNKRKKKQQGGADPLAAGSRKKGRNEVDAGGGFFDDL